MSYSLQVSNGDLTLGTQGMQTVNGSAKLTQDLKCAILESMGTDPLHPEYGSVIDGGTDLHGNIHQGIIGAQNDPVAADFVRSEIHRIEAWYQNQQIVRNQNDTYTYGRSTLTADEALLEILNIATTQVLDHLLVTATMRTGAGGLPLALPFTTA